jgi:hypothetical protein
MHGMYVLLVNGKYVHWPLKKQPFKADFKLFLGQRPLVPFLLLGPPFFPIILFGPPPGKPG